jgi:hypothetical protein
MRLPDKPIYCGNRAFRLLYWKERDSWLETLLYRLINGVWPPVNIEVVIIVRSGELQPYDKLIHIELMMPRCATSVTGPAEFVEYFGNSLIDKSLPRLHSEINIMICNMYRMGHGVDFNKHCRQGYGIKIFAKENYPIKGKNKEFLIWKKVLHILTPISREEVEKVVNDSEYLFGERLINV